MRSKKQTRNSSLTLKEWCELSGLTLTDLSELLPCSQPYPGMIDSGKAHPSFKMACRIEQVTNGLCPRSRWYPSEDEVIGE